MKTTRKVLALLLALVMAATAVCVTAFAAHKKQYQSYTFFGDSVTTGFGIQSYFDVAEEGGTAEGKRVAGAYPDLVAKGVGIDENNENYYNEAHSGWRTSELRETLDPSYNNDDGQVAKALSQNMANGKELADPQDPRLQQRIREEIAKSDLITIDLGSNDIQLPIIMALYAAIYPQYASYFGVQDYKQWVIEDLLQKYGAENDLITKLTEAVAKVHGIEYAIEVISKAALGGLHKFNTNYPAIINLIRDINPDADIYVIGLYNPMSEAMLSDSIPIPVGKALDPAILSLNLYLSQLCPARRYYTYVDAFNTTVLGTISLASFVGSDMNLAGMGDYTMYIHPNDAGHAYIAEQVLKAIPDVEDETPAEEPAAETPEEPAEEPASETPAQTVLNGLCKGTDGKWAMYKNNKVDTSFTGLAKSTYNGNWYYVKNGYLNRNYTGFGQNPTTKKWYRVLKGRVDWTANSIYKKPETGTWFKTTGGRVTFKETGVFKNENGWWYVKNSWVDFNKNGKVKYNGKTYTVKNGRALV